MKDVDQMGYINRMARKTKRIKKINSLNNRIDAFRENNISVSSINTAFVYIVTNEAFDSWYKVGTTVEINSRVQKYQTSDPLRRYKLLDQWIVKDRFKIEDEFLKYAARSSLFKVNREWVYSDSYKILKRKFSNFIANFKGA